MKIKKIRHTGIVVKNLGESLVFYRDKLGFNVVSEREEYGDYIDTMLGMDRTVVRTIKMQCRDGQMIELLEYQTNKPRFVARLINDIGVTHIALEVDDLRSLYGALSEHGTPFISKPVKSSDDAALVAFCIAPEGTHIELVEIL